MFEIVLKVIWVLMRKQISWLIWTIHDSVSKSDSNLRFSFRLLLTKEHLGDVFFNGECASDQHFFQFCTLFPFFFQNSDQLFKTSKFLHHQNFQKTRIFSIMYRWIERCCRLLNFLGYISLLLKTTVFELIDQSRRIFQVFARTSTL
jgi:hypothetical protein